jgi:5'-nucleotidase
LDQNLAASAVFTELVNDTSPKFAAIVTGHTHQAYAYQAPWPGQPGRTRPVVETGSYAANVGHITLTVDPDSKSVVASTVANQPRTTVDDATLISAYPRVSAVNATVTKALADAGTIGNDPVGSVTADITTAFTDPAGPCVQTGTTRYQRQSESTLGNLVANALLDRLTEPEAGGAEIGVVNPGGLRAELCYAPDGVITYAEANGVLPFVNNLWTTTLTGAQFKTALEQQWQRDAQGNIPSRNYLQLGLSDNVTYTFDPNAPEGSHITSVTVDGKPLDPAEDYRIGSFSFLLQGGDNFRVFAQGSNTKDSGLIDRDAWIAYIGANSPLAPSFARHGVQVTNQPTTAAAGATLSFGVAGLDLTSLGPVGTRTNTTLAAQLVPAAGGTAVDVGSTPVTGGAATVTVPVPARIAAGDWKLVLTAAPSRTVVTIPLTITATSSVALAATPATQVFGRSAVVLTATVTTSEAAAGSVEFRGGRQVLGTEDVKNGTAALQLPATTPAGSYDVVAHYSGDGDVPPADSAPVTVVVTKASSATLLAPGLSLPFVGTLLIGAVVLNNGQPAAGTIQIAGNGTAVGSTPVQRSGLFVLLAPPVGRGKSTTYTATFTPTDPANITGSTSNPVLVRR